MLIMIMIMVIPLEASAENYYDKTLNVFRDVLGDHLRGGGKVTDREALIEKMREKNYTMINLDKLMEDVFKFDSGNGVIDDYINNRDKTEVANANAASRIDSVLTGLLAGKGNVFVYYGNETGVDAYLMAAIAMQETGGDSKALRERNNVGGYMYSKGGLQNFDTIDESIGYGATLLAGDLYKGSGLDTVEKIGGRYCPVGADNDPNDLNRNWIPGVTKHYTDITGYPPGVFTWDWSGVMDGTGSLPGDNSRGIQSKYEEYMEGIKGLYDESSGTGIYYEQTEGDIVINYKFYRIVKKMIVGINWVITMLAYLMIVMVGFMWAMYAVALSGFHFFNDIMIKFTGVDVYEEGSMQRVITMSVVSMVLITLVLTGSAITILEKMVLKVMQIRI